MSDAIKWKTQCMQSFPSIVWTCQCYTHTTVSTSSFYLEPKHAVQAAKIGNIQNISMFALIKFLWWGQWVSGISGKSSLFSSCIALPNTAWKNVNTHDKKCIFIDVISHLETYIKFTYTNMLGNIIILSYFVGRRFYCGRLFSPYLHCVYVCRVVLYSPLIKNTPPVNK